MALSDADIAALGTEITDDPTGLGYAGQSDAAIALLINGAQVAIQLDNFVTAFDIVEAVVPGDFPTAAGDQFKRDLWRDILLTVGSETGGINANATNLKAKVLLVFGPATTTRTNLAGLQTRNGSRSEQLFGRDTLVVHQDVAKSLGRV